jgi:hypothetical protein
MSSELDDDSSGDELSVVMPLGDTTGASKLAPKTMEQAQRALMTSLKRPRRSYKRLEKEYGEQADILTSDGRVIKATDLAQLRPDVLLEMRREEVSAEDAVKSLGHEHLAVAESSKGGEGIKEMQAKRKAQHDEVITAWHIRQREFYDDAEDLVLEAGRALRSDLDALDQRIGKILSTLEDPLDAVTRDHPHVLARWEAVSGVEGERERRVEAFWQYLEGLEDRRCDELGEELRKMASRLVDIGHALPPAVERIVSKEALELNKLTLKNRHDAADVGAKLRAEAAKSRLRNRRRWEEAEQAWRELHHTRCVKTTLSRLESDEFVNPPSRQAASRSLRGEQTRVHQEERLPVLRELVSLRGEDLVEARVADVRRRFEAVAEAEARVASDGFARIREAQRLTDESGEEQRESLRKELHEYSALTPPSGLRQLARALRVEVLENSDLEDFFRRSGGLKAELDLLSTRAESDEVVYSTHLEAAAGRASLLVASLDMNQPLEAQGKGSDREATASTVDKMRSAKRTALPALVARLQSQTARLATAEGLHPLVTAELQACADSLMELCEQCFEALTSARMEVPAALRSLVTGEGGGVSAADSEDATGTPVASAGAGGPSSASVARRSTRAGSVGRRSARGGSVGKRSKASGGQKSSRKASDLGMGEDAQSTVIGQALPMAELRALQRRVGTVVSACELPDEAKELLGRLQGAIGRQADANAAVDSVIAEQIEPVLQKRQEEGAALCERVGKALERQARALESASVNMCRFWSRVARALKRHATAEEAVDVKTADDLNGALDAFEEADAAAEEEVQERSRKCRQAPNEEMLAEAFELVLQSLDSVESGYRSYHSNAVTIARAHVSEAGVNLRRHRSALCCLFGLRLVDAEAVDGPCDEGATVSDDPHEGLLPSLAYESLDGISPRSPRPAPTDESALLAEPVVPTPSCSVEQGAEKGWTPLAVRAEDKQVVAASEALGSGDEIARYFEEVGVDRLAGALVVTRRETEGEMQQRRREEELVEHKKQEEERLRAEEERRRAEEEAALAADPKKKKATEAAKAKPVLKGGKKEAQAAAAADEEEEARKQQLAAEAMREEDARAAAAREAELLLMVYPHGIEDDRRIPLDPAGAPVVEYCDVDSAEATRWVTDLRDWALGEFQAHVLHRRVSLTEQCTDRVELYTAELDERVRRHWPRKGQAETDLRAPREAELLAHAQRLERHARAWQERSKKQQDSFSVEVEEARSHVAQFEKKFDAFQDSLGAQSSLAALQGQYSRTKALLVSFETEADAWRRRLLVYCGAEPRKLRTQNREFLRTCTRFSEGGEYDPVEITAVEGVLSDLEGGLDSTIGERRSACSEVEGLQRAATSKMEGFETAFASALRALSMKEGLGQRFGEPRRKCTERLRTVLGWSDAAERRIVARLDELETLTEQAAESAKALRERETAAAAEAEAARRAGPAGTSASPVDKATAAATAAAKSAGQAVAKGEGVSGVVVGGAGLAPRTGYALGEDEEEEEATVRLMVQGRCLSDARGRAAAFVRRMRKKQRAALGEGAGDSTEEDDDDEESAEESKEGATPRRQGPKAVPDGLVFDPHSGGLVPSLSVRIRYCLLLLRQQLEHRARYLEAFKEELRSFDPCREMTLSDVSSKTTGGAPSSTDEDSSEQTLRQQVSETIEHCKANTRKLFEDEGEPLGPGDASLPQSLRDYLSREAARCEEARIDSCRKLRELVVRVWRLLSEAAAVAVADTASRYAKQVDAASDWARRKFRKSVKALVEVREMHAAQLVPGLGDPNRQAELDELEQSELERCADHKRSIAAGRARELRARAKAAHDLASRLLDCSSWCLRVSDSLVLPEDLRPLPGDEDLAPSKVGIRRLRKQLRRDAAEAKMAQEEAEAAAAAAAAAAPAKGKKGAPASPRADAPLATAEQPGLLPPIDEAGRLVDGAGVATRAYKRRRWEGLIPRPGEMLRLPVAPSWAEAAETEADGAFPLPADSDDVPPGRVVSLYNEATRHAVRTRDAAWRSCGEACRASLVASDKWFESLFDSVERWEGHWNGLVQSLRDKAAEATIE